MFDIAHATATARNDPAFADFFARAIGNYLLGAVFVESPSRDAVFAEERELDRPAAFGGFLTALAGGLRRRNSWIAASRSISSAEERYLEENAETEKRLAAGV